MSVSDTDWLLPIVTLPNPMLVGAAVREPGRTPLPLSGTVMAVFELFGVL